MSTNLESDLRLGSGNNLTNVTLVTMDMDMDLDMEVCVYHI